MKRYFVPVFCFFALPLILAGCAKKPSEPKIAVKAETGQDHAPAAKEAISKSVPIVSEDATVDMKVSGLDREQKILSFDMTGYTKDGQRKWAIKGESADIVADTVKLNNIEADTSDEERTVTLEADNGTYDKRSGSVKLEDNVVVITSDGIKLTADWFEWDSKTNAIKSDSKVEVTKDNLYACGIGAFANVGDKAVQLNRDVMVKQGDITITSNGALQINYTDKKASFIDKVRVSDPRGELMSDRLDIFFNTDTKNIEKIVAEGSVELKRGPNLAKSRKITYTPEDGKALLTGDPEIYIYSEKDVQDAFIGN